MPRKKGPESPGEECVRAARGVAPAPGTPGALVKQCVAGDAAAQALFIERYTELVRRAVLRGLACASEQTPLRRDADDVCNEVFSRILSDGCRRLLALRDAASLDAWLMVVARRCAADHVRGWQTEYRRRARAVHEPAADWSHLSMPSDATPATSAMARERSEELRRRLEVLTDRERLSLDLYYFHGLRYAEIAEVTSQKINTVAAQLHRARKKLRAAIDGPRTGEAP